MLRYMLRIVSTIFAMCESSYAQQMGRPYAFQYGFQKPASPIMEGIISMHNILIVIMIIVAVLVTSLLIYVIYKFRASKNPVPSQTTHHTLLEVIWTIFPIICVVIIMIPSVRLMKEVDKPQNPDMTIKVIGKQWYWTYEYPLGNDKKISFDSHMIEDKDLKPGQLRLLEVDEPIVVPVDATVQLLITAGDVIHSFAVPSLGIKKDAVPGRINETWFKINKKGTYYGQCSELCGVKHGYMPIAIRVVDQAEYSEWLKTKQN